MMDNREFIGTGRTHPELQVGERFITNVGPDHIDKYKDETKFRIGKLAYDVHDRVIDAKPVFKLIEERVIND